MLPLTHHGLAANYESAAALTKQHRPQDHFSAHYEQTPDWAIGPFHLDSSLTFTPTSQWPDPTGIGWTASAIFNPSLIRHDGGLIVFYRASPSMESTASRIGMAVHDPTAGWIDSSRNPLIYPTMDNELHGCEDPKIYRADGRYSLFYNAIFPIDPADAARYPSPDYVIEDIGCDINLAVSDDLVDWEKMGPIVPHEVSRLWCKGAVIPRDANGDAVRVGGEFLMYLSEGCNGTLHIGRSVDLIHWEFEEQQYLDLEPLNGLLHEVACAAALDDPRIVLDIFYSAGVAGTFAAQALYHRDSPFAQISLNKGGSLSWGGLLEHRGTWLFAQGWDAPAGVRELYFYRSARVDSSTPLR
ncbi:MAG: glycoside hydrolase family 130 protein [Actinomycetota bacterium]